MNLSRLMGKVVLALAAAKMGNELVKKGVLQKVATKGVTLAMVAVQSAKCQVLVARDGLEDIFAEANYIKEKNRNVYPPDKEMLSCPQQAKNIMINEESGG